MFVHQFNFTVKFVINKISEWGEMNKIIGISLYISIIITTIHKSIYPMATSCKHCDQYQKKINILTSDYEF